MRAALLVTSFLFLLLSHLPAFNSLSYFRANLFSCYTRYTELCPCDVTFHQPHLLLGHVILLQNMVFSPAWSGPAVNSWFPPVSWNGISAWRILCIMNEFCHNFTQSPHGKQFISVTLEEWWRNHELPPESALVLIPIHWRCLKNVQGKMY